MRPEGLRKLGWAGPDDPVAGPKSFLQRALIQCPMGVQSMSGARGPRPYGGDLVRPEGLILDWAGPLMP